MHGDSTDHQSNQLQAPACMQCSCRLRAPPTDSGDATDGGKSELAIERYQPMDALPHEQQSTPSPNTDGKSHESCTMQEPMIH